MTEEEERIAKDAAKIVAFLKRSPRWFQRIAVALAPENSHEPFGPKVKRAPGFLQLWSEAKKSQRILWCLAVVAFLTTGLSATWATFYFGQTVGNWIGVGQLASAMILGIAGCVENWSPLAILLVISFPIGVGTVSFVLGMASDSLPTGSG